MKDQQNDERTNVSPTASLKRLFSLDAIRGGIILGMLVVNQPGDPTAVYQQLRHVVWDGFVAADIGDAFFLWIIGVAMVFSIYGYSRRNEQSNTAKAFRHCIRRPAILLFLGLIIALFAVLPTFVRASDPAVFAQMRITGTLQRIGLCYFLAAPLLLWTGPRTWLVAIGGLIGGYWLLMTTIPVPGCVTGVLTPECNLANYLDQVLLGAHARTTDPYGLLGTFPAAASILSGALLGLLLRTGGLSIRQLSQLLAGGVLIMAAGLLLNTWIPINRNLWTPSYALLTVGIATWIAMVCYWLFDVRGIRRSVMPLDIFGMNAIVIFFLSEIAGIFITSRGMDCGDVGRVYIKECIYTTIFSPLGNPYTASLIFSFSWAFLFFLLAYALYKRGWFLRA